MTLDNFIGVQLRLGLIKKNFLERSIKKIKLHNLRSIKVASKFLFDKFPNIYISLYTKRDLNLAGYLYSDSSEYWNERYLELFENLRSLDQNIKDRFGIDLRCIQTVT